MTRMIEDAHHDQLADALPRAEHPRAQAGRVRVGPERVLAQLPPLRVVEVRPAVPDRHGGEVRRQSPPADLLEAESFSICARQEDSERRARRTGHESETHSPQSSRRPDLRLGFGGVEYRPSAAHAEVDVDHDVVAVPAARGGGGRFAEESE